MFVTTATAPKVECSTIQISSIIFLSLFAILLVCNLVGLIGYRIRSHRREKSRKQPRKVAIGRAKGILHEQSKVPRSHNNNNGPNFRALHDANGCVVDIPSIKIIQDSNDTGASSQDDGIYSRVHRKKRDATVTLHNLPLTAIPKPSGEYTDVLNFSKLRPDFYDNDQQEEQHLASSTPLALCPELKQNSNTFTNSVYITPVSDILAFPKSRNSCFLHAVESVSVAPTSPRENPKDGAYISFQENKHVRL